MNTRLYLLLERLQKLDGLLRLAQSQTAAPLEVARLHARKRSLRERLSRLMQPSTLKAL